MMKKVGQERVDNGRRRAMCFVATVPLASMGPVWATPVPDALRRPAFVGPQVRGAVLLDVVKAGQRIVVVGERGVVLFSDDVGVTWNQARVPVSVTLTAVKFVDEKFGWATGHAGVVLATADGGETWGLQLDGKRAVELWLAEVSAGSSNANRLAEAKRLVADGPDKPFVALHFSDRKHGIVMGAYGLIFATADGGETWAPWMARLDNPKALHLNALVVQGQRILLAGEQGLLLQSIDGGKTFAALSSPYPGSWFSAVALPDGKWMLAGLKGNVYTYGPAGFTQCEVPIPVTISYLSLMQDNSVLALNQAGQALISRDSGVRWVPVVLPQGPPLTAVVQVDGRRLLASSLRGVRELPFPK
jgi:photosystem II stability/assembly factor-like uncharacterized protein